MGSRLELQSELEQFVDNVYFQPPENIRMTHPCIVYNKSGKSQTHGNNHIYREKQQYQLTVIDRNPDSTIADDIEKNFEYCSIGQYFTMDGLNHTTLNLFY